MAGTIFLSASHMPAPPTCPPVHERVQRTGRDRPFATAAKMVFPPPLPAIRLSVEQNPAAQERAKFQGARGGVEADVKAAGEENEREAAEMDGGTLATLLRHHGRNVALRIRIGSPGPWIPYPPAVLQPEMRAICERTEKD
jgi:hypothetical protein